MIALRSDCLLFQLGNGETIPCSADMIAVEIIGEANSVLDSETLRHAAASVFHYFKVDLAREAVTIGEFSIALEKALHHLGYSIHAHTPGQTQGEMNGTDLGKIARESGESLELLFFPRLRDELRGCLRSSPRVVRFCGLRGCVKQLAGARRWTNRCEELQDQIVEYLRGCLTAETSRSDAAQSECSLVVE